MTNITIERKPRSSLVVTRDVIFALYLRELKARFGLYRLGLAWALLEPVAVIAILSTIKSMWFGDSVQGIEYPIFFMLGFMGYQIFNKLTNQAAASINANRGLFNFRQVRPIDAIASRVLLEVVIDVFVFGFLALGFLWLGFDMQVHNPLLFLAVVFNLILLG
ncbi:MAG: phosphate ABC transporter permease, partial [Phototrophicales bacterium]